MLQIRRVCDDPVCVHDEVNISIKAKVKIPGNYIQRRNARSSSLFYNFVLSAESNLELSSPARWYATLFIFCVCVYTADCRIHFRVGRVVRRFL